LSPEPSHPDDLQTAIREIHQLAAKRNGWEIRDLTSILAVAALIWSFSAAWTVASNRIDGLERANATLSLKVEKIAEVLAQLDTLKQSVARIEENSHEAARVSQETRDTLLKMGVLNAPNPSRIIR
jgi:hypothetical protein